MWLACRTGLCCSGARRTGCRSAQFADLDGASVLITGGGSGIGAALTTGFARQGSKVAFIDIADSRQHDALRRDRERAWPPAALSQRRPHRYRRAAKGGRAGAEAANGPIKVLVNNAAFDQRHAVEDVTSEFWDRNQAINLKPAFFAVQAVLPGMKQQGGSIINFTSTSLHAEHGRHAVLHRREGRRDRPHQGPGRASSAHMGYVSMRSRRVGS